MVWKLQYKLWNSGILKKILLFLVLGFLVPIVLVVLFFLQRLYRDMSEQAIASYQNVNLQMLQSLHTILESAEKYTTYPYYNSDFQKFLHNNYSTPQGFREITTDTRLYKRYIQEQILRYNANISSAILYNATSKTRFVGGYYYGGETTERLAQMMERLQQADAANGIVTAFSGSDSRRMTLIAAARPVFDPGNREYLGYFCLLMNAEELTDAFRQAQPQKGVRRYVLDADGLIVYDSDGTQVGLPAEGELLAFAGQDAAYIQQLLEGQHTTLLKVVSDRTGWRVISIVNTDILFEGVHAKQRNMSLILLGLFAAAMACAVWVAVSISRPVNRLQSAIASSVADRFQTSVPVTTRDEVGELARSFNRMQEEIKLLLAQVVKQENEKLTAEMHALQAQINPHFLYNTLNTIKWMANMQCADNISEATDGLVYMLRYASAMQGDFVTVRDEMQFVEKYLSLMQLRYCDSFDVVFDCAPDALECQSLRFLLQPFVENAIFHGFQGRAEQNILTVSARLERKKLVLIISDNGVGMSGDRLAQIVSPAKKKDSFNSIGVRNVMERVRLHYAEQGTVTLNSVAQQGTTVTIVVPATCKEAM